MKRPFFVWLGHFYSLGVISRWAVAPVLIGSQTPNNIAAKTAANAVRRIYMGIPHTSGRGVKKGVGADLAAWAFFSGLVRGGICRKSRTHRPRLRSENL